MTNASAALYTDVTVKSFSSTAMPLALHSLITLARVMPAS